MTSTPQPADHPEFERVLGRWDVIAVSFGAMIGFGWIVLAGDFLTGAGAVGASLAIIIGGLVVVFVAFTYAELVGAMPKAGGEHNYVLRAMGSRASFLTSWTLVLGYVSLVAFEAVAFPQTLLYLFPRMLAGKMWTFADYDVYASWVAIGVAAAAVITYVNYRGVKPAAVFQSIAVIFLLAVGFLLIAGTIIGGGSVENMKPLINGGWSGIVAVLVATPFLFVGFDVIPQSAGEIRLKPNMIGKILMLSVTMAIAWYVMVMLTVSFVIPAAEIADRSLPAADAVSRAWNSDFFGQVLLVGGIAGILTSWNGFMIGASRLVYAMGDSGMLPGWFGKLHGTHRTPSNAVLAVGALSIAAPFLGRKALVWFVDSGSVSIALAFFMVALAFIRLRVKEPDMDRPFRVKGGMAVGVIAAIGSVLMALAYLPFGPAALVWPYEWAIFGLWWITGILLWTRVPRVAAGPDAERQLHAARDETTVTVSSQ